MYKYDKKLDNIEFITFKLKIDNDDNLINYAMIEYIIWIILILKEFKIIIKLKLLFMNQH